MTATLLPRTSASSGLRRRGQLPISGHQAISSPPEFSEAWVRQDQTFGEHSLEEIVNVEEYPAALLYYEFVRYCHEVLNRLAHGPTRQLFISSLNDARRRTALCDVDITEGDTLERARLYRWKIGLSEASRAFDLPHQDEAPAVANDALRAVDELRDWLGLTYDDLEAMTGIAKNTFHHWRREGTKPRPSTVRRLWRVYTLIRALIAELGRAQAVAWLRAGPRSPLDLLLNGELEAAEEAVHLLLFRHPPVKPEEQPDYAPFRPEPEFEVRIEGSTDGPRRARRRPTRGRLPGS